MCSLIILIILLWDLTLYNNFQMFFHIKIVSNVFTISLRDVKVPKLCTFGGQMRINKI
jgi:hypothetical protein